MILRTVERQEAKIPEFEEVKERVVAAISEKKAKENALKKAEDTLAGLKDGKITMVKLPYKTQESGLFARGGSVPNAGVSEEMNTAAFSLSKDMPYPAKPISINDAVYIIKLKERVEAGRDGFTSEEPVIRERLKQQKGEEALRNWLKTARAKAKIKIYGEILE